MNFDNHALRLLFMEDESPRDGLCSYENHRHGESSK